MTEPNLPRKSDPASEADTWMVILSEPNVSRAKRLAFVRWLKRSPVHLEEYLRVASIRSLVRTAQDIDIKSTPAPKDQAGGNIVPWPWQRQRTDRASTSWSRRHWLFAVAMVCVIAIGTGLGVNTWLQEPPTIIQASTLRGEIKELDLPDGSRLSLNTDSSITATLSQDSRVVNINRGQVYIDVASDPERPFKVISRDAILTDIGTRFDVYIRPHDTLLTVLDGEVVVDPRWARSKTQVDDAPKRVSAGQRARLDEAGEVVELAAVDVDATPSWRAKRLDFDNMPLVDIAQEFNRYNMLQITVTDDAIGQQRLTGSFATTDPESFLATVALFPGVKIERQGTMRARITKK